MGAKGVPQGEAATLKRGCFPIEPWRSIALRAARADGYDTTSERDKRRGGRGLSGYRTKSFDNEQKSLRLLAEVSDMKESTLTKALFGDRKAVDFDTADRVLCALNLAPLVYYQQGTALAAQYQLVTLKDPVCALEGCDNAFYPKPGGKGSPTTNQKYCCPQHGNKARSLRRTAAARKLRAKLARKHRSKGVTT